MKFYERNCPNIGQHLVDFLRSSFAAEVFSGHPGDAVGARDHLARQGVQCLEWAHVRDEKDRTLSHIAHLVGYGEAAEAVEYSLRTALYDNFLCEELRDCEVQGRDWDFWQGLLRVVKPGRGKPVRNADVSGDAWGNLYNVQSFMFSRSGDPQNALDLLQSLDGFTVRRMIKF